MEWISDATYAAIREKREAKGKDKKRYQELKAEVQRKLLVQISEFLRRVISYSVLQTCYSDDSRFYHKFV